jgi:hypothetical protein
MRSWCMVAAPSRRSQAKRRTSCENLAANKESFEREIFARRLRSDPIYSVLELCSRKENRFRIYRGVSKTISEVQPC